jgi:rhodanese-related sulfurtransferase
MPTPPVELFRRLTNGVYVVTASHDGRSGGFTAAWVTQVSFDPLLLAISINPHNASWALIEKSGRFAINVHIPNEGSLPGTDLTLPYNDIQQRDDELPADHDTPLAIYCMTGHMSAIAGQTLTGLGYTDIVELDGGMEAWQVMGQPFIPAGG